MKLEIAPHTVPSPAHDARRATMIGRGRTQKRPALAQGLYRFTQLGRLPARQGALDDLRPSQPSEAQP